MEGYNQNIYLAKSYARFYETRTYCKIFRNNIEQAYDDGIPIILERWIMIGDSKINEEETVYIDIYPN